MTFSGDSYETLTILASYMFIYNLSLLIFFSILFQFFNFEVKTLYSFSALGSTNILSKILIITLLSMAGVPPFWGFFSKMFIFILILNSKFIFLFVFLFTLLFVALYFYIQNIRFLNSTSPENFIPITNMQLRVIPTLHYINFSILFFLIFGFLFTEDTFLFFTWIFL